jgi:hypothetical protein
MQITTRVAVIPIDAIQAAYNDAVMLGRMALAREIGQVWLSMLAKQKVAPLVPTFPRFTTQRGSQLYNLRLDRGSLDAVRA